MAVGVASPIKAPHGANGDSKSWNDWPNDAGFETFQDETFPVELKVSGNIPAYVAGTLYRTGPGGHQLKTSGDDFDMTHWFDGFAQTHRFHIVPPASGEQVSRVVYNSRHTSNNMILKIQKDGGYKAISFGQPADPCESFFRKVMTSYQAAIGIDAQGPSGVNVGVTIQANMPIKESHSNNTAATNSTSTDVPSHVDNLWVKTDNASLQSLHPTTLEPIAAIKQDKLHPDLKGPFTGAHSHTDPVTGDWFNYNLEVAPLHPVYRVFSVSAKTGEATILATLNGANFKAAYLHSFMLTERYVVLCIFNSHYGKNGMQVVWTRNMIDAMNFEPHTKTVWVVVDRLHGQGVVGIYETDPFFAFHPVNAWEVPSKTGEPGTVDIVADIPVYPNLDVLKRFYYENLKSTSSAAENYTGAKGESSKPSLTRFMLPNVGTSTVPQTSRPRPAETVFKASSYDSPELPAFNPRYALKPSRYVYGVSDRGHSTFLDGLIKFDTQSQTAKARVVHAQSPSEPIFLPDPKGVEEDDGVVLSVILDGTKGKSHLLVMDAKSFEEIGRAEMETVVPFGFHGTYVSSGGKLRG